MQKAKRLELQSKFEELLGSRNVYYQPPASVKMAYPAIRYSKMKIDSKYANNKKYLNKTLYNVVVIDSTPDNPVIEKLLELPLSSHDNWYAADGLNHDVIKLYY